jgi:hypothetical protein
MSSVTAEPQTVIPAKAGIQCLSASKSLDSSFRWNDEKWVSGDGIILKFGAWSYASRRVVNSFS